MLIYLDGDGYLVDRQWMPVTMLANVDSRASSSGTGYLALVIGCVSLPHTSHPVHYEPRVRGRY